VGNAFFGHHYMEPKGQKAYHQIGFGNKTIELLGLIGTPGNRVSTGRVVNQFASPLGCVRGYRHKIIPV
jgi:hypothetical protein